METVTCPWLSSERWEAGREYSYLLHHTSVSFWQVMKRSGKISDLHINEMMKRGDLDGDGWDKYWSQTILNWNLKLICRTWEYLMCDNFRKLTFEEFEKAIQKTWVGSGLHFYNAADINDKWCHFSSLLICTLSSNGDIQHLQPYRGCYRNTVCHFSPWSYLES